MLAPVMIVFGIVVGFRVFGILGAIVGAFLGIPLTIVPVALIVTCVYAHEKWTERRQRKGTLPDDTAQ